MKNIEKYKSDLKYLTERGDNLLISMKYSCYPKDIIKGLNTVFNKDENEVKKIINKLLPFYKEYQSWYSESIVLIKQLLPDRLSDFVKHYEKPQNRKSIEYGNYVIADYLQNLLVQDSFGESKVGPEAAIQQFEQQLNILKSVERRFESSLFDIKQMVQADLFDSELDAAKELNTNKFSRGAGAIAGVVLEKHLIQVHLNHNLKITKKAPSISDLNEKLKSSEIYDTPTWRKIQHLADIRNLCDHKKDREPTIDEVSELIIGVDSIIKTIY